MAKASGTRAGTHKADRAVPNNEKKMCGTRKTRMRKMSNTTGKVQNKNVSFGIPTSAQIPKV